MGDIDLPAPLQPLSYLAGAPWPKGSENGMFSLSSFWSDASSTVSGQIVDEVESIVAAIEKAYVSGPGRDSLVATLGSLIDPSGNQSLQAVAASMKQVAESADKVGDQIQAYKIQILVGLAWLAYDLATAWMAGPAAPAVEAAEIAATEAALAIVRQVVMEVIKAAAVGALIQGVTDALIQVIQIAQHHREGFDWSEFGQSVAVGAGGGAAGHAVASGLGKALDKTLGNKIEGALGGDRVECGAGFGWWYRRRFGWFGGRDAVQ